MDRSPPRVALVATTALLALLVAAGCGGAHRAPASAPTREVATEIPSNPGSQSVEHVVEPGQTAWRIARAYGVELEDLATANGLTDTTRIVAGQILVIPGASETRHVEPFRGATAVTATTAATTTAASGRGKLLYAWPVPGGRIVSAYGVPRRTHRHTGLDIDGRHGQKIVAAGDGTVVYSGATMRGYGKTVVVDHGGGIRTLYAHNSALLVQPGERVRRGQPIAKMGQTGNASGVHCHFEVRQDQKPIDPLGHARFEGAP